jgi:hypothetical protein
MYKSSKGKKQDLTLFALYKSSKGKKQDLTLFAVTLFADPVCMRRKWC